MPAPARSALGRAVAALLVERWLAAYGPLLLIILLFVVVALSGLLPRLGGVGHVLALVVFAMLAGWTWRRGRVLAKPVTEAEARRRVERASNLANRPLEALADRPALAPKLWPQHRARMAELLKAVPLAGEGLRWCSIPLLPGLTLALLLVVASFVMVWPERGERLEAAVSPDMAEVLPVSTLDAWVVPPAYTGEPPLALYRDSPRLTVPEGSEAKLRVSGGVFPPLVHANGTRLHFVRDGEGYALTLPLIQSGKLAVRQDGRELGAWNIALLVDAAPQVGFAKPPQPTRQQALRIDYTASDDIGLATLEVIVEPGQAGADSGVADPLSLPLPLASTPPEEAHGFRFFDLTDHPWAGSDVLLSLKATDVKGQVTESESVSLRLPAHEFHDPIAQEIIRLRRELSLRGMGARNIVTNALGVLAGEAEESHAGDWTGILALRTLAARLRFNEDAAVLPGVSRLMWDTAIHFDQGAKGSAMSELRRAQQELEDALANGASDAEIRQMMSQLQQAMNNYLDEMQQNPQQGGEGEQSGQTVSREDLQRMMDQMQALAQSGARDEARQMLSEMQRMMENLHSGSSGECSDPATQQALRQLEGIARDQQEMMQQSFRNSHEGEGEAPKPGEQEQLRQRLGEVMEQLDQQGHKVDELGEGERAMRQSREALEQGNPQQSMRRQGEALTRMQNGMRELREEMARQQGEGNTDPLGREAPRGGDTSRVEIPDADDMNRARRVLDELRQRAGDMNRSEDERGYLELLLRWF